MPGGGQAARRSLVETSRDRQLTEPGSRQSQAARHSQASVRPEAAGARPSQPARQSQTARQEPDSEPGRPRQSASQAGSGRA